MWFPPTRSDNDSSFVFQTPKDTYRTKTGAHKEDLTKGNLPLLQVLRLKTAEQK